MYIIVCVKQVKNYNLEKRKTSANSGSNDMFHNPVDLMALAWAMKLKQMYGFKVITISMGPLNAASQVRLLYSYGVDRAVLLSSKTLAGSDTYATSYALGELIRNYIPDYSMILCGDKTLDSETGQVPHSLAMALSISSYSNIVEILHKDDCFEVTCEMESDNVKIITEDKLLCTVTQGPKDYVNLPGIKNIIDSESKKIEILTSKDLKVKDEVIGQKGSYTKVISLHERNFTSKRKQKNFVFSDEKMGMIMKEILGEGL